MVEGQGENCDEKVFFYFGPLKEEKSCYPGKRGGGGGFYVWGGDISRQGKKKCVLDTGTGVVTKGGGKTAVS